MSVAPVQKEPSMTKESEVKVQRVLVVDAVELLHLNFFT
jgi:hypothetical protein